MNSLNSFGLKNEKHHLGYNILYKCYNILNEPIERIQYCCNAKVSPLFVLSMHQFCPGKETDLILLSCHNLTGKSNHLFGILIFFMVVYIENDII